MSFTDALEKLSKSIAELQKEKINPSAPPEKTRAYYDFKVQKQLLAIDRFNAALKTVKDHALTLNKLITIPENQQLVNEIMQLMPGFETLDLAKLQKTIKTVEPLARQLHIPRQISFKFPITMPDVIKPDLQEDLEEMHRCFENKCFRSAVILCGRIMETALHWKYYDATGFDLLEKSPGLGLGNLIAKLKEKDIDIDPALTNQIHLINQVRVFSVHTKKTVFSPSEDQTQAIILYTMDILNKLFVRGS